MSELTAIARFGKPVMACAFASQLLEAHPQLSAVVLERSAAGIEVLVLAEHAAAIAVHQ